MVSSYLSNKTAVNLFHIEYFNLEFIFSSIFIFFTSEEYEKIIFK